MDNSTTRADALIRALAARQHGVVSSAQLLAAGLTPRMVGYRLGAGRLERVLRGVYRAGPVRSGYEREAAAVLASRGVLCHWTAARLWAVHAGDDPAVDVLVAPNANCRLEGVRAHRIAGLGADEVTSLHGLPVTTPARTLLDMAALLGARDLERAVATALRANRTTVGELNRLVARHPRSGGARALARLLAADEEPAFTRSAAEDAFVALVRSAKIAAPKSNVPVNGYEVDFLWRAEKLIVEVDGRAYHGSASAFERDRLRDATLAAKGYVVLRFTWSQLTKEPVAVMARVVEALARR